MVDTDRPLSGTRDRRRSGGQRARSSTALDRCCTAMLGPVRPTAGSQNRQSRRHAFAATLRCRPRGRCGRRLRRRALRGAVAEDQRISRSPPFGFRRSAVLEIRCESPEADGADSESHPSSRPRNGAGDQACRAAILNETALPPVGERRRRTSDAIRQAPRHSALGVRPSRARGRRRGCNARRCRRVPGGCRPPGPRPFRCRGVARPRPVHPAADSAGTPQPGVRPRHAGRPVRPADARRDSGVAAVAGSLTDGVSEQRRSGASSNGRHTATSGGDSSPAAPGRSRSRSERLLAGANAFHATGSLRDRGRHGVATNCRCCGSPTAIGLICICICACRPAGGIAANGHG